MILEPELTPMPASSAGAHIRLPEGLVGLPDATDFELVATQESLPLMWLRNVSGDRLSFPVVEPGPLVKNYEMELHDADAEALGLTAGGKHPLVLTILTMRSVSPQKATINLIAPIVINRDTLIGKQVLLANYERYSVEYPVIDEKA